MIRIHKGKEPDILARNKNEWTKQLLCHIANGDKVPSTLRDKYNHHEVKAALKDECNSKCMYCESNVSHVSYEHIEHIKPKAQNKYPELTFEWHNLGLACPRCNINKGNIYDEFCPFVNPYSDEPSSFLFAVGLFVYHKPNNARGELTEKQIDLNRPDLIERRKERIDMIRNLFDRYCSENNATLKKVLKQELLIEIAEDKPYSFCAKSIYAALLQST
jgi:hypothetical protein